MPPLFLDAMAGKATTAPVPLRIRVYHLTFDMMERDSRKLIGALERDGWQRVGTTGSHHHFKHPEKPGKVTIPHPVKDLPQGTGRQIYRQAGLPIR